MILITGATGTIGRELLPILAGQGEEVRALTRDPARLAGLPGVEVVQGDLGDADSLVKAVDGASAVFLLSTGPDLPAHDAAITRAAVSAGARTLVKLSTVVTGLPGLRLAELHRPGEAAVRDSGLGWTILRPSTFASNMLGFADAVRGGAPIPNLSGRGLQGVVDPADIAAVAAAALTGDGHHGRIYTLTGPEPISVPDQAAILADVLGRPVRTSDVPLDRARADMLAGGAQPDMVEAMIEGAEFVAAGRNAVVTADVAAVLGRPARTFRQWAEDHRAAFA